MLETVWNLVFFELNLLPPDGIGWIYRIAQTVYAAAVILALTLVAWKNREINAMRLPLP